MRPIMLLRMIVPLVLLATSVTSSNAQMITLKDLDKTVKPKLKAFLMTDAGKELIKPLQGVVDVNESQLNIASKDGKPSKVTWTAVSKKPLSPEEEEQVKEILGSLLGQTLFDNGKGLNQEDGKQVFDVFEPKIIVGAAPPPGDKPKPPPGPDPKPTPPPGPGTVPPVPNPPAPPPGNPKAIAEMLQQLEALQKKIGKLPPEVINNTKDFPDLIEELERLIAVLEKPMTQFAGDLTPYRQGVKMLQDRVAKMSLTTDREQPKPTKPNLENPPPEGKPTPDGNIPAPKQDTPSPSGGKKSGSGGKKSSGSGSSRSSSSGVAVTCIPTYRCIPTCCGCYYVMDVMYVEVPVCGSSTVYNDSQDSSSGGGMTSGEQDQANYSYSQRNMLASNRGGDNAAGYYQRSIQAYARGQFKESVALAQSAVDRDENDARLWYSRALSERAVGDVVAAQNSVQRGAEIDVLAGNIPSIASSPIISAPRSEAAQIAYNPAPRIATPDVVAQQAKPATVTLNVPADGKLLVDGKEFPMADNERTFTTPALVPGKKYFYQMKVEVVRDGQMQTETQLVQVESGKHLEVNFKQLNETKTVRK